MKSRNQDEARHGRVGQTVATALQHHGLSYVVVEADRKLAERLRAKNCM
jgi:voltage-gated potassium channel Kch